ncbi:MAG: hypothetical protein ACI83W_001574 [Marinoscillum sp.]|jgi:hypothetical protein
MKHFFLISIFLGHLAFSQGADEILEAHFKSYGQSTWLDVNTLSIDGRSIDEHFAGAPMQLIFKAPDKVKIIGRYKGKLYAEAFDGQYAWIKAPWKPSYEAQLMNAEEELVMRNVMTIGSPLYSDRDHLKFEGLKDFEGELYLVFTMNEGQYLKTYYLDRDEYKLHFEEISTRFGSPVRVLKVFEKYKKYGDMLMPTAVIFEGLTVRKEYTFDEVLMGIGIKSGIFDMPDSQ